MLPPWERAELIAGQQALGEQQGRHDVLDLAQSHRIDLRIVRRASGATIPRAVVAAAVVVVLAVRLVVLVVVGDEVVEREAVMRGDEVNAGPGLAPLAIETIG